MIRPPSRVPAIVVGVVGLLAVGTVQIVPNRHAMEDDLTGRAVQALQVAGVTGADVRFTGRDAVLRVPAADAGRAVGIVRDLAGVRAVEVRSPEQAAAATQVTPQPSAPQAAAPRSAAPQVAAPDRSAPRAAVSEPSVAPRSRPTGADTARPRATLRTPGAEAGTAGGGHIETPSRNSPAAASVQRQLTALPPITFLPASAGLTPAAQVTVQAAAQILHRAPTLRVRLVGHTDSDGSAAANLRLSRARAESVLTMLVLYGVASARMSAVGVGATRPTVPDAGPAADRRVEIVVTQP